MKAQLQQETEAQRKQGRFRSPLTDKDKQPRGSCSFFACTFHLRSTAVCMPRSSGAYVLNDLDDFILGLLPLSTLSLLYLTTLTFCEFFANQVIGQNFKAQTILTASTNPALQFINSPLIFIRLRWTAIVTLEVSTSCWRHVLDLRIISNLAKTREAPIHLSLKALRPEEAQLKRNPISIAVTFFEVKNNSFSIHSSHTFSSFFGSCFTCVIIVCCSNLNHHD